MIIIGILLIVIGFLLPDVSVSDGFIVLLRPILILAGVFSILGSLIIKL